jgi:hypothetical protein
LSTSTHENFVFSLIYSVRWRDPVHETGAHRRIGIEEATTEEKVNTKPAGNRKKRKLEWIPFPPIISPTTTRFSFIICLKPFCFVFFFFRCGGGRIYYYPLLPLFKIFNSLPLVEKHKIKKGPNK